MYSLLLALIYIAFISLGLPDSLLGSGWPAMRADLGVPVSYMGIVSMVISAEPSFPACFRIHLRENAARAWLRPSACCSPPSLCSDFPFQVSFGC